MKSAPRKSVTVAQGVRYLTSPEMAELLGVSVFTLLRLRKAGEGPPFIKIGRSVRYPIAAAAPRAAAA